MSTRGANIRGVAICLTVLAVVSADGIGLAQQRYHNPAPSVFEDPAREAWQRPDDVVKTLGLEAGMTVVDLGAGTGFFTRRFAQAVGLKGKAIGLDVDPDMVAYMKKDAQARNLANYEARTVTPDDAGLPPQSADLVFLCNTYHLLSDRVSYFRRLKEALKPGGRLVVVDWSPTAFRGNSQVLDPQITKNELREAGYDLQVAYDFLPRQVFFVFVPSR